MEANLPCIGCGKSGEEAPRKSKDQPPQKLKNMTIEEKARQLVGCDSLYCKSSDTNFCRTCITKPWKKSCREIANMLEVANFVIDKAVAWLHENCTDYFDKIQDCYGGNELETQTWSFPEEFFTKFKNEIKNGDE